MSLPASLVGEFARATVAMTDGLRGRRLSILVFHRVLPEADPLFPGAVDAERFDTLMRLLGRAFQVMPLGRAVAHLRADTLPARALAITFDDGYADNADVALPLLQRHGLPATFFIATGFLDGGRMWNDTIIETLRRCRHDSVDLGAFGLGRFPLGSAAQRRAAVDALVGVVKYQEPQVREESLQTLSGLAGHPLLPDDLMMTSDQVRHMHRSGMEIGGHTMDHPILCTLTDAQARAQIDGGRQALQALIDAPVDVFAYPNGGPDRDYDQRHVDIVRDLGFRGAVTTAVGSAGPGDDLFQLPRYTPWEMGLVRWGARLVASRSSSTFRRASAAIGG